MASYEIGWPVAQDNDMETWRNFENRYWPAKYLFNSRGERIYNHFGEGAYGETEQRIRAALVEAGADLSDDPLNLPQDQVRDSAFQEAGSSGSAPVTPELYAGWHRNFLTLQAGRAPYVAQVEFFESITDPTDNESTGVIDVTVPQDIRQHYLYFNGQWSVEPERIRHARQTESLEDYLALNYAARSVNVVLTLRIRRTLPGVCNRRWGHADARKCRIRYPVRRERAFIPVGGRTTSVRYGRQSRIPSGIRPHHAV